MIRFGLKWYKYYVVQRMTIFYVIKKKKRQTKHTYKTGERSASLYFHEESSVCHNKHVSYESSLLRFCTLPTRCHLYQLDSIILQPESYVLFQQSMAQQKWTIHQLWCHNDLCSLPYSLLCMTQPHSLCNIISSRCGHWDRPALFDQ